MLYIEAIQKALRHVNAQYPDVTQVFYNSQGQWFFCSDDFEAPSFNEDLNEQLLDEAANAAYNQGLPFAHKLFKLEDLYSLWDDFGDKSSIDDKDCLEEPYLHFGAGTHREDVWHWFENQHPKFIVGELQQGIKRMDPEHWSVTLNMEDGSTFSWEGDADDSNHAEGQAIAEATGNRGIQVMSVATIKRNASSFA